ncbi:MAG TPA: penicillin-insensitive murein endopeptidase [Kofleriaceae bacterium]|nr:penicillin-insensitive murein endopeptidase [Kofleriaceae bacterium]
MRSWLVVLVVIALGDVARADRTHTHTVEARQTLSSIAKRYGCTVAAIKEANQLTSDALDIDQQLIIPDECEKPSTEKPKAVKVVTGQSIGRPWNGHLAHPAELPSGKGYHIRRPWRAFGATHVVGYIQRAIAEARQKFPKAHVLAIGDISQKRGGEISDHHSHQSGRDVDIGFFYKKQPADYPQDFVTADESNLDCEKTLSLIESFAKTHDKPGGVQMIFLDFELQGILYRWGKKHGVDVDHLEWLFQYPHGRGSSDGIVRHEPNHSDHFHVRFQCPPDDDRCE